MVINSLKVAVGSTNRSKILAVKRAWAILGNADIVGVKVDSGVPEQPKGIKQILLGAINRAFRALEHVKADYGVGIEAGYIDIGSITMDVQIALIVDNEGYVSLGFSPSFQVPHEALRYDTLGEYMAKITGRKTINEEVGAIGYLTKGIITRADLTYQAVVMALIPRINRQLYSNLMKINELIEDVNKETL